MFDPTTRLQAARLHGEDLHRSAQAHHAPRRKLRRTHPLGSAFRARAHDLAEALRSPVSGASAATSGSALDPCPAGPRPALDR